MDRRAQAVPERISVVIPVLDGAETLPTLLEALFSQRAPCEYEVVVVDSGSRDGSRDLAKRHPVTLVDVRPSEFDHGETRNLGIRHATGEIIVLLTQDAIPVGTHFLTEIVRPFEDSRVAGVYGRQIPRDDCDVVTARNLRGWMAGRGQAARAQLGSGRLEDLTPAERHELCVFDNVCSAMRRSAWEDQPFPRTRFGEDIAWGKQAITRGWTIAYAPEAAVVHSHRRSLGYEYRRTRVCHETLHELFELETIPRARDVLRAVAWCLSNDLPYVFGNAPPGLERLRQLVRVAGLSIVSPLAQHQGIRDARRGRGRPRRPSHP
jgi:rhamnosyltransferase